jgi:hypothetical protein
MRAQARAAAELGQQEARSRSLEAANRAHLESLQPGGAAAAAAAGEGAAADGTGAAAGAAADGGGVPSRAPLPPLRRPWNSSASLGAGDSDGGPPPSTRSEDGERRSVPWRALPHIPCLLIQLLLFPAIPSYPWLVQGDLPC